MAAEENKEAGEKKTGKGGLIKTAVVGVLAIGAGAAAPIVMQKLNPPTQTQSDETKAKPVSTLAIPEANDKVTYIEFEEVVVNLNEPRFNRYLKLSLSLQVAESQKTEIEKLLTERKAVLKNWLISHIADKTAEDIKGKFGHNRLRREVHDFFNATLFDDGIERIQDILFRDFGIQ